MLSFALTGPMTLLIRSPLFETIRLTDQPLWLKIVCYPFIMIPIFYIILLGIGSLFGQFTFFWNRIKSMMPWDSKNPD